jgi:hypothetical protein
VGTQKLHLRVALVVEEVVSQKVSQEKRVRVNDKVETVREGVAWGGG